MSPRRWLLLDYLAWKALPKRSTTLWATKRIEEDEIGVEETGTDDIGADDIGADENGDARFALDNLGDEARVR